MSVDRDWSLRAATPQDAEWLADLKAAAMRPDLERLGRWDHGRARARFLETYVPSTTYIIVLENEDVGCVTVRPEPDAWWIEHFYLWPRVQAGASVAKFCSMRWRPTGTGGLSCSP